jgi:hypothetical protein
MQKRWAAMAALVLVVLTSTATTAQAAPTVVNVRVEGRTTTLFDHAIITDGHTIRATSDRVSRPCDGTNLGANPAPGPTPTAATVDAMLSLGQGFDGLWYDGFNDYFIQQFGPDREDAANYAYWGILVNNVFTQVGGCQYRLSAGDNVLWVWDAFNGKKFLNLSGPATATLNTPVAYNVVGSSQTTDSNGTSEPRSGATVGGVGANGQDVSGTVTSGTSNASGVASVTFTQLGWQRVKARQSGAISSNSVDVCVTDATHTTCTGAPPSQQPITPPADPHAGDTPVYTGSGGVPNGATSQSVTGVAPTASPTSTTPAATTPATADPASSAPAPVAAPAVQLTGTPTLRGRSAGLAWTVTSPGSGLAGWTVAVREDGGKGAFAVKARGTTETSTTLSLTPGRAYTLRLTVTDRDGRVSAPADTTVLVPTTSGLRRSGAWKGAVGGQGATATIRLAAGRPTFVLSGPASAAKVEIRTGQTRRIVRVGALRSGATKTVTGRAAKRAGTTTFRVLSGRVRLTGALVLS